jgi:hypothetical protein
VKWPFGKRANRDDQWELIAVAGSLEPPYYEPAWMHIKKTFKSKLRGGTRYVEAYKCSKCEHVTERSWIV